MEYMLSLAVWSVSAEAVCWIGAAIALILVLVIAPIILWDRRKPSERPYNHCNASRMFRFGINRYRQ